MEKIQKDHNKQLIPAQTIVVIPTLNEEDHIEACIESLIDDRFTGDVQIVVSDGGSKDRTTEIVSALGKRFPNVSLVDNPKRLQSAAVNIAVEKSSFPRTRYLVRCDAHALYPSGYLRRAVGSLAGRPEAASVCGVLDARGETCFARAAAWVVDTPLGSGGAAHRGGRQSGWVDHGHHVGFKIDWYNQLGGYDAEFSHNEDGEYDYRLAKAGGRIWLDASLRVDYVMRQGPTALARQYWNYGDGRARTILKHGIRPRIRQMIPPINVVILVSSVPVMFVFPFAAAFFAFYLTVLMGTSIFAAISMRSFCGLWAGIALALMHNAWGTGFLLRMTRNFVKRFFEVK